MGLLNIAPRNAVLVAKNKEISGVFTPAATASKNLTTSGTTANTILPTGANFLRLCSDTAIYYKLGADNTVAATAADNFLPANVIEHIPVEANTYIAAINK